MVEEEKLEEEASGPRRRIFMRGWEGGGGVGAGKETGLVAELRLGVSSSSSHASRTRILA